MDFKEQARTQISLRFQIITTAISVTVLLLLINWRSSLFTPREKIPQLHAITPQIYDRFGGFAKTVQTGLLINQFINFNMVTNEFTIDGVVWFTFDPGAISIDTLERFSFNKGEILSKSPPNIQLIDEKLNVKYQVRLKFRSTLDNSDFPLDDHRIFIVMANHYVSPSEIIFESYRRQFVIEADVSTTGWQLVDHRVQTGYFESKLDPDDPRQTLSYPAAMFIMEYARNSIRYALSIILPLILICYLILFSISMRLISAIAITASGITAILAYRFVIENLSPKTGFFMLSDYLFFLFLAGTIATFFIHIAESRYNLPPIYKKMYIILMHVAIIATAIYVLYW